MFLIPLKSPVITDFYGHNCRLQMLVYPLQVGFKKASEAAVRKRDDDSVPVGCEKIWDSPRNIPSGNLT